VVPGCKLLVVAPLHHEGVGLAPHDVYLRNEEPVDIPGDAPAYMASDGRVTVVTTSRSNLSKEDPILRFIALYSRYEPGLV